MVRFPERSRASAKARSRQITTVIPCPHISRLGGPLRRSICTMWRRISDWFPAKHSWATLSSVGARYCPMCWTAYCGLVKKPCGSRSDRARAAWRWDVAMLLTRIRAFFSTRSSVDPDKTALRAEREFSDGRFSNAAVLFRELADAGSAGAQVRLAQLYEHGQGVLQSFVEAVRWYRSAAEQGAVAAQSRLGEIYLTGLEPPATASSSAVARIESADTQGSMLKRLFPLGLSVPRDPEQAASWNTAAAEGGNAAAQARLAYQYATGSGVARDLAAAERWFLAAAKQDEVSGQLGLGMLFAGSYGEHGKPGLAVEWLEKAAAQDNATAKLCLALLFLYSTDVVRNYARARRLLQEAANATLPTAMFHLGEMYRRGLGVEVNRSQAETWLSRAAVHGHVKALLSLVWLFNSGPEPDANTAATRCRQAADLGDGEAQCTLGQFYLAGKGVPRDPVEAARW